MRIKSLDMIGENISLKVYRLIFHFLVLSVLLCIPLILGPKSPIVTGSTINDQNEFQSRFLYRWITLESILTTLYLVNVYVYIPSFLKRSKYIKYFIVILGSSVTAILLINVINSYLTSTVLQSNLPSSPPAPGVLGSFVPMLMYLAVGTSFEMIVNWEMLRRERSQIEKEKMSSELSFLRSQMNPHFLFNTLNNIYSLAEKKSDKTGEAVLMISALLRYILYDSSGGKISLAKEIECLENYIAIQRLRISSKESVTIQFNVTGNRSDVLVEPLILLPFVENAFKHGVSYSQKCNVLIEIGLENSTLELHVYNTKKFNSQHRDTLEKDFGIGLNNVKKRLALLYPEHHELLIEETDEYFEVQLKILL